MRKDMNLRQQKDNPPKKTKFVTQKNTIKNTNPKSFVQDSKAKIKHVRNPAPNALKATPKLNTTSNFVCQIPSAELDYYNVRIFVLSYFLDHNRDLNNDVTLQILDKTIRKILKHLNEEQ